VWLYVIIGPAFGRNFGLADLRAVIGASLTNKRNSHPFQRESAVLLSHSSPFTGPE
jgi:hypothetical protein